VTALNTRLCRVAVVILPVLLAPSAATAVERHDKSFLLRVQGAVGSSEPKILRAVKGDRVRIEVLAVRPVVVHIHGLGVEIVAGPERPGEASLSANATGRFPVHVHDAKADGAHHHRAPFAYLEVYPK
jgi:hypothetical protein